MKLIYTMLLLGLLSFSCGIKGPPLPPIDEETIQKQKADQLASQQAAQQAKAAEAASSDTTKAKKKTSK